jgi:hypothetical protein
MKESKWEEEKGENPKIRTFHYKTHTIVVRETQIEIYFDFGDNGVFTGIVYSFKDLNNILAKFNLPELRRDKS